MAIQRVGNGYIEVLDEGGLRNLVRINAIQSISDVDELREETYLTVASRTILVRSPLDELREVLEENGSLRRY